MSVYEIAPPEVVTEREQRARTLEAAALEIEVRGWARGSSCNSSGNVCMVGGIAAALGHDPENATYDHARYAWGGGDAFHTGLIWTTFGPARPIPAFNDGLARSAEEVTFLLRWRAEEIRDGWEA